MSGPSPRAGNRETPRRHGFVSGFRFPPERLAQGTVAAAVVVSFDELPVADVDGSGGLPALVAVVGVMPGRGDVARDWPRRSGTSRLALRLGRGRDLGAMKMHVLPFTLDPLPDAGLFECAFYRSAFSVEFLDQPHVAADDGRIGAEQANLRCHRVVFRGPRLPFSSK